VIGRQREVEHDGDPDKCDADREHPDEKPGRRRAGLDADGDQAIERFDELMAGALAL
jgi:hypothetical protein